MESNITVRPAKTGDAGRICFTLLQKDLYHMIFYALWYSFHIEKGLMAQIRAAARSSYLRRRMKENDKAPYTSIFFVSKKAGTCKRPMYMELQAYGSMRKDDLYVTQLLLFLNNRNSFLDIL